MGRRNKENFRDEWIVWVIIIGLIIYAIVTAIFWLLILAIAILILFIAYEISDYIEELWIQILVWFMAFLLIFIWWSEILKNYWKINRSIIDYSFDTAKELRLKTSNKWNIKIESDYWTLIETKN